LRDIVVVRGYSSWPSQGELKALADRAGNLFIFASTKLKITGNVSSMSYYMLQPLQVLLLTNPVSKSFRLTPDRELSLVQEELEISFGMEPTPSMEEIWSEVDQMLNLDDRMGPLDVGGYDIRYLFSLTFRPHVNISVVPCFDGCSKNRTVIKFSTPENVLFTCQHENCACSENVIDELAIEDVYTIWLLDSGASMHFMPNQFDFTCMRKSMMSLQQLHLDKK